MKVFDSYSEYLREEKSYDDWKAARNKTEARRAAYIANVGVSDLQKKSDLRRAEAVLNSIDVMDEYSQARAEDMEVVTDQLKVYIMELGGYIGFGLGGLMLTTSKTIKNAYQQVFKHKNFKLAPKLILPAVITAVPILGSIVLSSVWGAGVETKASRFGRAEAINEKLNSPNQFAELTDEQEQKVKEIADGIYLPPKEAKKKNKSTKGFGIFKSFKTIIAPKESEKRTIEEINRKIESDKENFDKVVLNETEIREAKRDQQLIQNVVEKIDIASQEYAEDVELATSTVTGTALAGGLLTGYLTSKILTKFHKAASHAKLIAVAVGAAIPIIVSIYSAKIQKQASRVGRFKVKQDFRNNPEKLVYVDDEAAINQNEKEYLENNKKPNFFKFLSEVIRDNREYNKYMENEYVEATKKSMAREQIELTPEQKTRAEQLQMNTFKTFNKLDDKSQAFSESTEAVGEMTSGVLTDTIMLGGMVVSALCATKNKLKSVSNAKTTIIAYAPLALSVIASILINIRITKKQKRASKVANMLAINEMNDYRNFVNYNDKVKNSELISVKQE